MEDFFEAMERKKHLEVTKLSCDNYANHKETIWGI